VLILTVIQGADKDRRFELPDHEPQFIGRSSESLPINDSAISRRHAELTPDEGVWYINDLKSQNGTYVNGVRIDRRTRLHVGDQIRVGRTVLVFGQTETRDPDIVRVVGKRHIDATIERSLQSSPLFSASANDDSLILAEPEPRAAAVDHLRVIYKLTTLVTAGVLDRQELLKGVLDLVFAELHPERGCIMLASSVDAPEESLTPAAVKYREAPLDQESARIQVSRTILQHTMRQAEGVLSSNAMSDPRFAKGDSVQRLHIRSALCSPIRFRDRAFGAIYVDSSIANYTFTAEQLALLNAIGQHTGLALANAELYEQKLQTERLATIGETVATLSHSIKNILQGLRGGADVVEMGLKKDDLKIAHGGWGILKRNLDRIISLTMNMLAFSRQRQAEPELARLNELIEECCSLLQAQCAARQVVLLFDPDHELPPVPIDSSLMHQAVMNLLTNAIEAVPATYGAVTVKTAYLPMAPGAKEESRGGIRFSPPAARDLTRQGPCFEIAVIDNGPGIPASKLPWVFEPFNTTKGVRGTGLGLAVARRVCEDHGGRIWVESEEGRGCTFRIRIPTDPIVMMDPSATSQTKPGGGLSPSGGETVRPRGRDSGRA
jgi:signal transduction histidine kinase